MRCRFIKPSWGTDILPGPKVYEGEFTPEYIQSKNAEGYNVYFFPNHNSKEVNGKWLSGKEVDVYTWIFVDMDLKDGIYESKDAFIEKVAQFQLEPSRIVDSGNGVHVYWKISNLDRNSLINLQFRLINEFNTDSSVWTPLQLMRIPGSINTKNRDKFIQSQTLLERDNTYTVEDFNILPDISESQKEKQLQHMNKLDGISESLDIDSLDADQLPTCFEKMLETDQYVRKLWYTEHGSRSDADWSLAHLLFDKNYHKLYEALPVLLNTQKALSKGNYRKEYAWNTIEKVWNEKENYAVPPVSKMKNMLSMKKTGERFHGPVYFDATFQGWRKGEVLGMIAGSGVGKTTATLDIFYEMMRNNPEKDDVFIFFSLEMPEHSIISRWEALIGEDKHLSDRLYVISNEDINGSPRHINLQKLYWFAEGIKRNSGKELAAIAVDHLGALERDIDISKKPNFGIMGEDLGFGTTRNIPFDALPGKMKELAKILNSFLILQSQTTKERSKNGDVELGLDAAFGSAKYEWFMDYIMTLWQPLRRVEHETDLRILGWQYAKIREKNSADKIKTFEKKILFVNIDNGKLRALHDEEMIEFKAMDEKATKLRELAEKKKGAEYSNSDGGIKKLRAILTKVN